MNPCELVTLISSISCLIAKDKSPEEISLLSAFFTQLGDSLATIASVQDYNQDKSNIEKTPTSKSK